MPSPYRLYRSLTRLYPSSFRREYRDDLVQHFADLAADRGLRAAWIRSGLDLAITVPRYHLEPLMTEPHSNIALNIAVGLVVAGGLAVTLVDSWVGLVLLVASLGLMATKRSALARALRMPDSGRRRDRLRKAAVLAGIFVASYGTFLLTVGDTWSPSDTILALVGTPAMFGAVGFLLAGLLTPRGPVSDPLADTAC